jgi:hypothetical protein
VKAVFKKESYSQVPVAQPAILATQEAVSVQEDLSLKPAWATVWETLSIKTYHKKGLVECLKW